MTNPTPDLTRDRLDELEVDATRGFIVINGAMTGVGDEIIVLIAMAKRTEAAERELVIANERVRAYQISSETMGELADKLGRERDALRTLLDDAYTIKENVRDADEACYWCDGVPPRNYEMNPANLSHDEDCLGERIRAALAEHGGDA